MSAVTQETISGKKDQQSILDAFEAVLLALFG